MIAAVGRGSQEPSPQLSPQASGSPAFQVQFSRPSAASGGRSDSRSNTFRWTGLGTIHVLERGLLVMTRRRSPFGFRTADERFVPASEICEVYREGDSVRVDLRGDERRGAFFQFWTGNPATAGTIVRLLPTTRTIEYEGTAAEPMPAPRLSASLRRRRSQRRVLAIALVVGLVSAISVLITNFALRQTKTDPVRIQLPTPVAVPAPAAVELPRATPAEVASALAQMRRFDDRIDGLRAQYRMAFLALQSGHLSQDEFVDGINKWLIPQWRALYGELASNSPDEGALTALIRKKLMAAAIGWDRGLQDYAAALQTRSYESVIASFDRMSDGNEARREAWRILDRAELAASEPSASSPRKP
ncbi:MAG TPA: hypothetical protein VNO35_05625 [Steroidobacteraceae bacterium]|nr:hypothetical protein [Steroidobacteraceae bacterium]